MNKGPFTPEGDTWILAGNGQPYWPAAPEMEDVDLIVIVWSLAQKVRFGGHGRKFYSVAQHSVFVSELTEAILSDTLVPSEDSYRFIGDVARHALFHDAHEAYLADLPSPLKKLPWLEPEWRKLEDAWDAVIFPVLKVKTNAVIKAEVKLTDLTAMYVEGHQIMPETPGEWEWPGHGSSSPKVKLYAEKYGHLLGELLDPVDAEVAFYARLHDLERRWQK